GALIRRPVSPGGNYARDVDNKAAGLRRGHWGGRIEGTACPIAKCSNFKRTSEMSKQPKVSADQVKDQAAEAGKFARQFADDAREWATPRVEAAKDWAGPRVDKAWREAVEAAAPRIAEAAQKSRGAVDTAHDKLVDDVLPLVVEKMEEAAEAASKGADTASGKADRALK